MSKLVESLSGISGILVAPFNEDDRLDIYRLRPVVNRALAAGVHILVANGNTGEFYGMTTDEALRHVEGCVDIVSGRAPVLGGVGKSIHDARAIARTSAKCGADGLMVHQPPDPFVAPRGVVDYVKRVRDAGEGLPIVLYLRNDAIGADAIAELCAIEGVVGVKWATPRPENLAAAIKASPEGIAWVGGLAETWAPALTEAGARGFTSGLINVWPERSMAIHAALEKGDFAGAKELIAGMEAFEAIRAEEMNGTNVTGVKAALALMGDDCGPTRPPSAWPLTETQQAKLQAFMEGAGLLKR